MKREEVIRVLHVAPTPFFSDRGCHIRIEGIIKALNKKNVESILCTYHHGHERPEIDTRRIPVIKHYDDYRPGPHPAKYLADLKLLWQTQKLLRSYRPHIIHAHLHEGVLIGWLAKWITLSPRTPLVADIQGGLVRELGSHNYFERFQLLERAFKGVEYLILRFPQHIFFSSLSCMKMLRRDYSLSAGGTTLLGDRVDASTVNIRIDKNLGHKITVAYSGSLTPPKGLPVLLEVLYRLLHRRPDMHVLLVGYPVEETVAFLKAKGMTDRCSVTGRVDFNNLLYHLTEADIGIDPKPSSTIEGSAKILNYMAAGLPVVAFDSENNRGLLGPQQLLVPDGSIDGFVERIEFLVDHPEVRRIEGDRNQQRVRKELTWDNSINQVLSIYEQLLSGVESDKQQVTK
jgi:glycosyltransferase involved in cell wall biosynthesis